jgi:hypothetical protein
MFITQSLLRQQAAFREFADISHWVDPVAVTLTMKQAIQPTDGHQRRLLYLDRYSASQNLRHCLNTLNCKVFGNRFRRFGEKLRVIPVLEGGNGKRLHYHLMTDCPRADLKDQFPAMIRDAWEATTWGYYQSDIQTGADEGWKLYISKLRDKPDYADAIDWPNYHNPDRRA